MKKNLSSDINKLPISSSRVAIFWTGILQNSPSNEKCVRFILNECSQLIAFCYGVLMRALVGLIFIIFITLTSKADAFSGHSMLLGSGKTVEIIDIGPMRYEDGRSALRLNYRTLIPLTDLFSLRKEADEIWDRFVEEVDISGYQEAVISAYEPKKEGFKNSNGSYNFIFKKKEQSWRTDEDQSQDKLDEKFVKKFIDRLDWVYDHNEIKAFLVYLANDWTVTFIDQGESSSGSRTIDRKTFAESADQSFSALKDFHHRRDIIRITILEGGRSAEVESRETEEGIINGQNNRLLEHSLDILEFNDRVVTIKKSTVTFERIEKVLYGRVYRIKYRI